MSNKKHTTRTNYNIKINSTYLMFGIVVFVVGCFLPLNTVLAADPAGGLELAGMELTQMINEFVKVSSWLWVFLANIAGSFMSNSMIYGEVIGMDIPLWNIWNVMKNFANYTLGFIFIASVFKTLFKGQPASLIKSTFPKLLASAVLIQASWFLMGAMIDVSNVAMGAAGSFVQEFMDGEKGAAGFKTTGSRPSRIDLNFQQSDGSDSPDYIETGEDMDNSEIMDNFTPSYDNLSGPLLFMGYSIFRFHDYTTIESIDFSDIVVTTFLKLAMLVMFIMPLIILIVVNIIRVFWIRMAVMFAPFLILDAFFGNFISGKIDKFNIVSIIKLVFQPVVIMITLGLSLLILISMYDVFAVGDGAGENSQNSSIDMGGAQFSGSEVTTSAAKISIKGSMFKDSNTIGNYAGGMFGYLILSFFTIMLLWGVLKAGFKFSDITEGVANNMYDFSENMMQTAPIVPVPGGGSTSLGAVKQGYRSFDATSGSDNIIASQSESQQRAINKMLGLNNSFTDRDFNDIKAGLKEGDLSSQAQTRAFFNNLRNTIDNKNMDNLTIAGNKDFESYLEYWWNNGGSKYLIKNTNISDAQLKDSDGNTISLQEAIRKSNRVKSFLHTAIKNGGSIKYDSSTVNDEFFEDTVGDLKNEDYS